MNCRKIQNQLLLHEPDALPSAVRQHIRECAECRAFDRAARLVLEHPFTDDEPHDKLDRAVMAAAARETAMPLSRHRRVRFWLVSRGARIAAAAAVVTLLVWAFRFRVYTPATNPGVSAGKQMAMATGKTHKTAWSDSDVDEYLLAIETALAVMTEPGSEDTSAATGTDNGSAVGNRSSIDEAIQRLDADIFFEQEGIRESETIPADIPRAGNDSLSAAPWA